MSCYKQGEKKGHGAGVNTMGDPDATTSCSKAVVSDTAFPPSSKVEGRGPQRSDFAIQVVACWKQLAPDATKAMKQLER